MSKNRKIYLLTILLIAVCALSVYLIIFQSYHHYGTWLAALCVALLFVSILILQFLWIDAAPGSFWTYNIRTLTVIVLMIPIVYGLTKAENNYENNGLRQYGTEATVLVTYIYKTTGNKVGTTYHAVYQYQVNGQTYTQTLNSRNSIYRLGDTVHIMYSSEHPNISTVIGYDHK